MNSREAIKLGLNCSNGVVLRYLGDLTDAELLVRPVPGANHTAWQLGHLISAEHSMVEGACPGSMPPLPAGFAEKYAKENSKLDSSGAFHPKSVYLKAYEEQRAATLKALDKLSDADLDKPAPEKFRGFVKTVGDLFSLQGSHWLMHAGQWAVTRRKLGRPPLF
ncbi:MAG: DinB family protein [Planctomycetaceae bacterium]